MVLLYHFSVTLTENGTYVFVENVSGKIVSELSTDQVITTETGYALSFDGKTKVNIHLDTFGFDLSKLTTGTLEIVFRVHDIPTERAVAPIFSYGGFESHGIDANNKGFMIEAGHDPIIPKNQSLFYTVYGSDHLHETRMGKTEFPSFCYDSKDPLPTNEWHMFNVVVSSEGTTGFLNGEEVNRRYNFGKPEDIAFFAAGRAHQEINLGYGHWFGSEMYLKGDIADIKIHG